MAFAAAMFHDAGGRESAVDALHRWSGRSLDPEIVHARLTLYKASERCPSALTPAQRAVISYVTSVLNDTPHCATQVLVKLRELDFSDHDIAALDDGRYETLPAPDAALARWVVQRRWGERRAERAEEIL